MSLVRRLCICAWEAQSSRPDSGTRLAGWTPAQCRTCVSSAGKKRTKCDSAWKVGIDRSATVYTYTAMALERAVEAQKLNAKVQE